MVFCTTFDEKIKKMPKSKANRIVETNPFLSREVNFNSLNIPTTNKNNPIIE